MKGKVICCRQQRIVLEKRIPPVRQENLETWQKRKEWPRAQALVPILMKVNHSVAKAPRKGLLYTRTAPIALILMTTKQMATPL